MLAANGLTRVVMAGDPGWYDLDWIDRVDFANERPGIAFTPPANPLFHQQALALLRAVVSWVGAPAVTVVFHRGSQATFAEESAKLGVETRDITGGAQGFAIYDDVGLHIGYRVHAHLYCTSRATPSYLVAEDSRGSGVLETLGPLGVSGLRPRVGSFLDRAWRLAPRVGSQRTTATRRAGLAASRLARLPDVSGPLLERIAHDKGSGYPDHRAAKSTIGRTYPVMAELLRAIP